MIMPILKIINDDVNFLWMMMLIQKLRWLMLIIKIKMIDVNYKN